MYKDIITRKEFEEMPEEARRFIDFLTINYKIWRLDENKNYIITEEGKRQSDDHDYLRGNGRPYRT